MGGISSASDFVFRALHALNRLKPRMKKLLVFQGVSISDAFIATADKPVPFLN